MVYKTFIFDFDGVLCRDRFYTHTLFPQYKNIVDWIQGNVFGNVELVEKWMRGQTTSEEINKIVAEAHGFEFTFLHKEFLKSVQLMQLNENIKKLVRKLKVSGRKVGLVTNNMDVFSDITIKNHKLDELFDVIINSSDYGMLKKDNNGELFDIALRKLKSEIRDSLVIDDSSVVIEMYHQKGGQGFLYTEFEGLKNFLNT